LFFQAATSYAAFIAHDLSAPGDGLLTLDTETGFKWLDFRVTKDLSIDDIKAGIGGWSTSFRYATYEEAGDLLAHAGLWPDGDSYWVPEKFGPAIDFISYFGEVDRTSLGAAVDYPEPCREECHRYAYLLNVQINNYREGLGYLWPDFVRFNQWGIGNALIQISPDVAVAPEEISVVPEPTTLTLLALGFAGLVFGRRGEK